MTLLPLALIALQVAAHSLPPQTLPDGRERIVWLDFGKSGSAPAGAFTYDGTAPNDMYTWTGGMVRVVRRDYPRHPAYLCDFMEGEDATFELSLDAVTLCRVVVTLGDPDRPRGPVDLSLPDGVVTEGLKTAAGEYLDVGFEAAPDSGRIRLHFKGRDCASFAVSGLAVYADPGTRLTAGLHAENRRTGAPVVPAASNGATDGLALEVLERACRFLVDSRPAGGCFSFRGAWYECAYPIRTLLAGGRLLNEPAYTEAAVECLDRFVAEQRADGNWSATFFGIPSCELSRLDRGNNESANLADVGTIVLALVAGSADVDAARRDTWLAAARRYADEIVLPNQREDGGFPNLKHSGQDYFHPYSVATGVQAGQLAALYGATGDGRYMEAAENAARYLLADFAEGRYNFKPHDQPAPKLIPFTRFGDLFYVLEGLVWVRQYTGDETLARSIDAGIEKYLWGGGGIAGSRVNAVFWRPINDWEASKSGGLLFLLTEYRRRVTSAIEGGATDNRQVRNRDGTEQWIRDFQTWLANPVQAAAYGIGMSPTSREGTYAFAATGFAGIGLASVVDPGSLFPRLPRN